MQFINIPKMFINGFGFSDPNHILEFIGTKMKQRYSYLNHYEVSSVSLYDEADEYWTKIRNWKITLKDYTFNKNSIEITDDIIFIENEDYIEIRCFIY